MSLLALVSFCLCSGLPDGNARRLNDPLPSIPRADVQRVVAFSPDGELLAYVVFDHVSYLDIRYSIHVARRDGSAPPIELHEIHDIHLYSVPALLEFTPDSSQLLIQLANGQLFSAPVDGSAAAFDWGTGLARAVTPDSTRLLYIQSGGGLGSFVLKSAPLDHSSPPLVLNGPMVNGGRVRSFAIAPDGSFVAYFAEQISGTGVYRSPVNAANGVLLAPANDASSLTVAPGGTRVLYLDESLSGRVQLFSVLANGSSGAVALGGSLPFNANVVPGFRITPDGTRVVFGVTGSAAAGLYSNLLTGGAPTLLDTGEVSSLELAAGGARAVYGGELDTLAMAELYTVPVNGSGAPTRLNGPLAPAEDVLEFRVGTDGTRVGFTAGVAGSESLYSAPADGGGPAVEIDAHIATHVFGTPMEFAVLAERFLWRRPVVDGLELRSAPVAGGPHVTLDHGETVAAFAASPDGLEVAFAGDEDEATVTELYVCPVDANGPAVRVSHELPNAVAGSSVSEFHTARSYAVYLSDPDASGGAGVFSAPLRYSAPPVRISDPLVDALGGLVLAEEVGRALFRGAFVNREWLFSAPVEGRGRLIALNYDPPIDGRITSVVLGPGGGFAVFLGDQEVDDVFELYVARTDTQGLPIQLSGALVAGGDVVPGFQIAPDGARVVYVADQDVDDVFELYATDGSAPVKLSGPLVSGGDVLPDPMFSPDGSRVYYRADQDVDGRVELYVVPADGSAAPVALNGPLAAGGDVEDEFRTTPDGSAIVFRADALVDGRFDLFSTSADGSSSFLEQLNTAPAASSVSDGFLIDANGSRVVFHADSRLFSVPALGGEPPVPLVGSSGSVVPLHHFDVETRGFRITPDGSTVLYRGNQETSGAAELWAVAIDGAGGSRRVNGPIGSAGVGNFDIDPTGETVAYVRLGASARRLYVGPLDGSSLPVAIDDPAEGVGSQDDFTFSGDGRSVIYRNDREALGAYDLFAVLLGGPRLDLAPTADPTPR